jgi:methylmalonyl-CoA mutase N-terminal domain/subunit
MTEDNVKIEESLGRRNKAAKGSQYLFPDICDAVERYATVGEIKNTLQKWLGKPRPFVTGLQARH